MTDFAALEEVDGVRLTWNIWPNSKLEATKCVIPFAALYTPNRKLPNMPVRASLLQPDLRSPDCLRNTGEALMLQVLPYEPIPCKQCTALLNPYARVDYYSKVNHAPA